DALSQFLRLQDQEVCVAHDGHAALQLAGSMQPEIVFLDLQLPKLNGLEVARRLRTGWPIRPLLLVATTGFGQEDDRRRSAEAGSDHHLVNPIDPQVLKSLLASVAYPRGVANRQRRTADLAHSVSCRRSPRAGTSPLAGYGASRAW